MAVKNPNLVVACEAVEDVGTTSESSDVVENSEFWVDVDIMGGAIGGVGRARVLELGSAVKRSKWRVGLVAGNKIGNVWGTCGAFCIPSLVTSEVVVVVRLVVVVVTLEVCVLLVVAAWEARSRIRSGTELVV